MSPRRATPNSYGELGDGTYGIFGEVPVQVSGLTSGVAAIAAGSGQSAHTCALVNGGVRCWGGNWSGQLGNGTSGGFSEVPVDVRFP
jgi:alpha-tubulin suppressor-like RCC1 family protein